MCLLLKNKGILLIIEKDISLDHLEPQFLKTSYLQAVHKICRVWDKKRRIQKKAYEKMSDLR